MAHGDSAASNLNAMAGKAPLESLRKRARTSDAEMDPPSKKKAVGRPRKSQDNTDEGKQPSKGRLKRTTRLPIQRPSHGRRNEFDIPADEVDPPLSFPEERMPKRKRNLKSNARGPKKNFLDAQGENVIDPLKEPKVILTSYDSPAKGTRSQTSANLTARLMNIRPGKVLEEHKKKKKRRTTLPAEEIEHRESIQGAAQQQEADDAAVSTEIRDDAIPPRSNAKNKLRPRKSRGEVVKSKETDNDCNTERQPDLTAATSDVEVQRNHDVAEGDEIRNDDNTRARKADNTTSIVQQPANEPEPQSGSNKPQVEVDNQQGAVTSPRSARSSGEVVSGTQDVGSHGELSASYEDDQDTDERITERQEDEEEKKWREAFERRGSTFLKGVTEAAKELRLESEWRYLGGAALTIEQVSVKKQELRGEAVQSLEKAITCLTGDYDKLRSSKEPETSKLEANVDTGIQTVQEKSTYDSLKVDNARGKDIYEQIIPLAVQMLKAGIKARYRNGLTEKACLELLKLSQTCVEICTAAQEWFPRPTTCKAGVKNLVRRQIKPNLSATSERLRDKASQLQTTRRQKKGLECLRQQQAILSARQKEVDQERLQDIAVPFSKRCLPLSTKTVTVSTTHVVHDIDEIDTSADHASEHVSATNRQPLSNITQLHAAGLQHVYKAPSGLCRSPDDTRQEGSRSVDRRPVVPPSIEWTEEDDECLVNGLQLYTGGSRYGKIWEKNPQLQSKDLDEIMARARYIKQTCLGDVQFRRRSDLAALSWLLSIVD